MDYAILLKRRLLFLTGEDTEGFLQGLITNDIGRLSQGQMLYSALLSPQGKFLHDFFITRWRGGYWIDCNASRMDDLRQRLMLYRLRAKVTIEHAVDDMGVAALWKGDTPPAMVDADMLVAVDPRLPELGLRAIGSKAAMSGWCEKQGMVKADDSAYEAWRIRHAVPDGAQDMVADKSLIMQFGYEQLHGVDFKKGCYVGQEVTARSKFRGSLRKSLYAVQAESGILPPAGTDIRAGEALVGTMCSSAGGSGLAVLRVPDLEKAAGSGFPLRAGDVVLTARLPEWMEEPSAA